MDLTTLFTDIEDSTRLWEQHGERMARALAAHDRLAHGAIQSHRGTVVKTTFAHGFPRVSRSATSAQSG